MSGVYILPASNGPAPGKYLNPITPIWDIGSDVEKIVYNINENPPTVSEYNFHDTETNSTPFVASTFDGGGRIVFDGGLSKYYNKYNDGTYNTFDDLPTHLKYLYNVLRKIANESRYDDGYRKILILGDANLGEPHCVKEVLGDEHLKLAFEAVRRVGLDGDVDDQWELVYKTRSDYDPNSLEPVLNELEDYVSLVLLSTVNSNSPYLTERGLEELLAWRKMGFSMLVITGKGSTLPTLSSATGNHSGYFRTANYLATSFGAWFSGDHQRDPMEVSDLRNNPEAEMFLENIDDSETLMGGNNESRVFVNQNLTYYTPSTLPVIKVTLQGVSSINFLVIGTDGSIDSFTYDYIVGDMGTLKFLNDNGIHVTNEIDVGIFNTVSLDLSFDSSFSDGTSKGFIYRNSDVIGEFNNYDTSGNNVLWYTGKLVPIFVNDGDIIKARIETPFIMEESIRIKRFQTVNINTVSLAHVIGRLINYT